MDQFSGNLKVQIPVDVGIFICSEIMEFDLKWVNVAGYKLTLRLDGAMWLTIIFQPLLTHGRSKNPKRISVSPHRWITLIKWHTAKSKHHVRKERN